MFRIVLALFVAFFAFGCTTRAVDTKLTPQLMENGEILYVYQDLANFARPDDDADAEKIRVKELKDWLSDAELCGNGFEIIKRQPIVTRSWASAKRIYYFIKCK